MNTQTQAHVVVTASSASSQQHVMDPISSMDETRTAKCDIIIQQHHQQQEEELLDVNNKGSVPIDTNDGIGHATTEDTCHSSSSIRSNDGGEQRVSKRNRSPAACSDDRRVDSSRSRGSHSRGKVQGEEGAVQSGSEAGDRDDAKQEMVRNRHRQQHRNRRREEKEERARQQDRILQCRLQLVVSHVNAMTREVERIRWLNGQAAVAVMKEALRRLGTVGFMIIPFSAVVEEQRHRRVSLGLSHSQVCRGYCYNLYGKGGGGRHENDGDGSGSSGRESLLMHQIEEVDMKKNALFFPPVKKVTAKEEEKMEEQQQQQDEAEELSRIINGVCGELRSSSYDDEPRFQQKLLEVMFHFRERHAAMLKMETSSSSQSKAATAIAKSKKIKYAAAKLNKAKRRRSRRRPKIFLDTDHFVPGESDDEESSDSSRRSSDSDDETDDDDGGGCGRYPVLLQSPARAAAASLPLFSSTAAAGIANSHSSSSNSSTLKLVSSMNSKSPTQMGDGSMIGGMMGSFGFASSSSSHLSPSSSGMPSTGTGGTGGRHAAANPLYHENLVRRLVSSAVRASCLGHRTCHRVWGPRGCGKRRVLNSVIARCQDLFNAPIEERKGESSPSDTALVASSGSRSAATSASAMPSAVTSAAAAVTESVCGVPHVTEKVINDDPNGGSRQRQHLNDSLRQSKPLVLTGGGATSPSDGSGGVASHQRRNSTGGAAMPSVPAHTHATTTTDDTRGRSLLTLELDSVIHTSDDTAIAALLSSLYRYYRHDILPRYHWFCDRRDEQRKRLRKQQRSSTSSTRNTSSSGSNHQVPPQQPQNEYEVEVAIDTKAEETVYQVRDALSLLFDIQLKQIAEALESASVIHTLSVGGGLPARGDLDDATTMKSSEAVGGDNTSSSSSALRDRLIEEALSLSSSLHQWDKQSQSGSHNSSSANKNKKKTGGAHHRSLSMLTNADAAARLFTTVGATALSALQHALIITSQAGVSLLMVIHGVNRFSTVCDRTMYMLSNLVHELAMGDGKGGVSLIFSSESQDLGLEKRLSSRLTPQSWVAPPLSLSLMSLLEYCFTPHFPSQPSSPFAAPLFCSPVSHLSGGTSTTDEDQISFHTRCELIRERFLDHLRNPSSQLYQAYLPVSTYLTHAGCSTEFAVQAAIHCLGGGPVPPVRDIGMGGELNSAAGNRIMDPEVCAAMSILGLNTPDAIPEPIPGLQQYLQSHVQSEGDPFTFEFDASTTSIATAVARHCANKNGNSSSTAGNIAMMQQHYQRYPREKFLLLAMMLTGEWQRAPSLIDLMRVLNSRLQATNSVRRIDVFRHTHAFAEAQASLVRNRFLRIKANNSSSKQRGGMILTTPRQGLIEFLLSVIHRAGLSETEKLVFLPLLKR